MTRLKLLGISASPRGEGNSHFLLSVASRAAEAAQEVETEIYSFEKKDFAPCVHCYGCRRTGDCVVQDDFQDLAEKWFAANALLYSVPVYHMSIPGQLKCFLDRLGAVTAGRERAKGGETISQKYLKPVGIITQGMHAFSGQEHAATELINHALLMGCLPISGNLWQSYISASGWTECLPDKTALEDLVKQGSPSAIATVTAAQAVGRNVAQLALIVKKGREFICQDSVANPVGNTLRIEEKGEAG